MATEVRRAKISSPMSTIRKWLFESGSKERPNIEVFYAVSAVHVMLRRSLAQSQHNKAIHVSSCDWCARDFALNHILSNFAKVREVILC
jgi:DNA-binding helix-hairpin-helix protein with protein kinase domain